MTNPNALKMLARNTIFTNVALTDDGDVWWEGLTDEALAHPTRLAGPRLDAGLRQPGGPPQLPVHRGRGPMPFDGPGIGRPSRVPISAILFGGRRATAVPLVTEAYSWQHGVFMGATIASETTAAATGQVGQLRHDPFAMLPFCGYNMGDYFGHWLAIGGMTDPDKLPRFYAVNWFRKDAEASSPGPASARTAACSSGSPSGCPARPGPPPPRSATCPRPAPWTSMASRSATAPWNCCCRWTPTWQDEADHIREYFITFGSHLPERLWDEHEALLERLKTA